MVVYLFSDASKDVTGQVYTVVGGRIAVWNQPVEVRQMTTEGRWTPEEIAARLDEMGVEKMGLIDRARGLPKCRGHGREAQRLIRSRVQGVRHMRFNYAESMTDPSFYLPLARAAEEAGYDGFIVVPDSLCYPMESDTRYPFNPDGTREFLEDKPFLDPFALMAAMGAVTERLRFVTFVMKLPIRHPVLVAKQAASVAVLTGNRFSLGVGTSPWPEDYEVLDIPWEGRGRRMDECIEVIRGLTRRTAGSSSTTARSSRSPPSRWLRPPAPPCPCSSVGTDRPPCAGPRGLADGWMHGGGDPAELPRLLGELGRRLEEAGRDGTHFEIHVISMDAYSPDGVRRLEEQGVTDVIVGFRWPYVAGPDTQDLHTKVDNLRRFADQVIHKL